MALQRNPGNHARTLLLAQVLSVIAPFDSLLANMKCAMLRLYLGTYHHSTLSSRTSQGGDNMSRTPRSFTLIVSVIVGLVLLTGCVAPSAPAPAAPAATQPPAPAATEPPAPPADPMADLIKAAKAEGMLTTIALPHDWCNYGEAIETFKAKYGLEVNELNPDAGSGDEIQAIIANKDNTGPQAPDVIDVGLGFGPQIIEDKLVPT